MSILVCSDLHGQYDLWQMIKKDLKEDDTLFFLGDACDRGPEGWKIIKELLSDKRITYIQGNHEDMLYRRYHGFGLDSVRLHDINGGQVTAEAAEQDPDKEQIVKQLHQLPYFAIVTLDDGKTIFLSHSGYSQHIDWDDPILHDKFLWDRQHYYQPQYDYDLVVHGHTPVDYLIEDLQFYDMSCDTKEGSWDGGAYFYAEGTKCDIDLGAHFTGRTVVLNLETLESHVYVQ